MTSQIVLMNGFGVAVASDSAVTLGSSRTYDTAEKIIPLPAPHRMAVLQAGDVRLGNIPYSVFLEEWIRQLGPKALRSAEAYQNSFQDWLSNNPQWISDDAEKNEVLRFIRTRAESLATRFGHLVKDDPEFQFTDLLESWTNDAAEWERLESASPDLARSTFARYADDIDAIFEEHLANVSESPTLKTDFITYCAQYFSSAEMTRSTLTFAGYGEHEILPSYTSISLHGFIDKMLRWVKGEKWSLSPDQSPLFGISLIAQREAIDQYLRGYDEEMMSTVIDYSLGESSSLLEQVRAQLGKIREEFPGAAEALGRVDIAIDEVWENYENKLFEIVNSFSETHYVRPLRFAISSLPAASLVDVARSLIELQALRKTTTAQQGTVGGPIDVALITPANGFTWVRHKSIG